MKRSLVVAEHDHRTVRSATFSAVTAALIVGGEVDVLVAGCDAVGAANQAAAITRVSRVLHADSPTLEHGLAENVGPLVVAAVQEYGYSHVVFPATAAGKNVAPRTAALLDVAQISDVTKVISDDTFERPIYAGNAIATVQSTDAVKVLTIRTASFPSAGVGAATAKIVSLQVGADAGLSTFVRAEITRTDRPELTAARVVVAGGRGLGSKEQFDGLLEPLADRLGAALGASRAAVDAGYAANDLQVGQTGKVVAPDLYIAVAISGAIQHLAGMKESKVIVAINKDADAPIFQVADYGLIADIFTAVPELVGQLGG